ncbi:MAG: FadR family transcriptional regulator [Clostridia bacterium]|nr:FadR family transcriptional regulator [Clostridia bacterium]
MKQSLTAQVIEKLKVAILSGEYAPGDRLPTLREMTELYDVSRSVVNAVVVDLESNGYIKIVPTKWIEVADWKTEGNLSILSDLVAYGLYDEKQLNDLLESRKFLELECVKKACINATREDVGRLRALIALEAAEDDPKKRSRCDLRFHYAICRMSGNMVYSIIMKAFEDSSYPLIKLFYNDPEVYGFVIEKHQRIARAIETHNATEAEAQMRLLLEHGETITRKLLQRRSPNGSKV